MAELVDDGRLAAEERVDPGQAVTGGQRVRVFGAEESRASSEDLGEALPGAAQPALLRDDPGQCVGGGECQRVVLSQDPQLVAEDCGEGPLGGGQVAIAVDGEHPGTRVPGGEPGGMLVVDLVEAQERPVEQGEGGLVATGLHHGRSALFGQVQRGSVLFGGGEGGAVDDLGDVWFQPPDLQPGCGRARVE